MAGEKDQKGTESQVSVIDWPDDSGWVPMAGVSSQTGFISSRLCWIAWVGSTRQGQADSSAGLACDGEITAQHFALV